MVQEILLAETNGLTPSEFASVLGTSGKTGAEGEKIGNSWLASDLATVFCDQWSDDAIALRDSRSRRTDQISSVVGNYTLSEWETIDEYYEDPEEEVDFAEGIYGTMGAEKSAREGYDDDQE